MLPIFSLVYFVLPVISFATGIIFMAINKPGRPQRGRPPAPRETVRRNRVVTFLKDGQLETLKRLADRNKTTLSQACHQLIKKELA